MKDVAAGLSTDREHSDCKFTGSQNIGEIGPPGRGRGLMIVGRVAERAAVCVDHDKADESRIALLDLGEVSIASFGVLRLYRWKLRQRNQGLMNSLNGLPLLCRGEFSQVESLACTSIWRVRRRSNSLYAWIPIAGSSATATSTSSRNRRVTSHRAPVLVFARRGNDCCLGLDRRRNFVMCPPFDRPRTVIRRSGRHHAELNCFMQISALPSRKIRGPCYDSVSIEGNLVTTVTRLAASVVGGKVRCVIRCRHIECLSAERQCEGCRPNCTGAIARPVLDPWRSDRGENCRPSVTVDRRRR